MKYLILVIITLIALSCSKDEIKTYNSPNAIVFENTITGGFILKKEKSNYLNFGIQSKGENLKKDTVNIIVNLEGIISDKALKIKLKSMPVKDVAECEFIFEDYYTIKPNSYRDSLKVIIKRPTIIDSIHQSKIVFDFVGSDFVQGVDEKKSIDVRVEDRVNMKLMGIPSMAHWNYYIGRKIGGYSDTKLRFIVNTLGVSTFRDLVTAINLPKNVELLRTKLEEYNNANPNNPLKDKKGNLINFN